MGQPAGALGRLHPKAGHPQRGITALRLVGLVAGTHASTHQIEGRISLRNGGELVPSRDWRAQSG